jgi:hypothetical protein
MPGYMKELVYPTCKLLVAILVANAIISIYIGAFNGNDPIRTLVDLSFLESGAMMIIGGSVMIQSPRIESRGSKILFGAFLLFLATIALALISIGLS